MPSSPLSIRRDQRTRSSTNTRTTFAPWLLLLISAALAALSLSLQAQASGLISATGLTQGQALRSGQLFTPNVELLPPMIVSGATLVIGVSCSSGVSQSFQMTVAVGSSTAADAQTIMAGGADGSCTWTYVSGDTRYAGWTQTITLTGPTFVASGVPAGGRVQVGTTRSLMLTVAPAVSSNLVVDVTCKSGGSAVGMLNPPFLEFAQGDTVRTAQYTVPSSPMDVTCDFTARTVGDDTFADKTTALSFSTATAPSLSVSGIEPATVLVTDSTHTLTLTASPPVANGAITVTSTCALSPASFVLEDGATTVDVTYTAPDTPRDAVSCSFHLARGGDPYFAAITIVGAIAFAVDVPLVIAADAAPVLAVGRTQPVSLSFSRAVATGGLQLTATCSAGSVPSPFTVSAAATTHVVQYTADAAEAEGVTCTFARQSGDDRYTGLTATLTRDVVAVGLDVSGPTAGAELLGSSTTEFTVTASHAVFGSNPLVVAASCSDGAGVVGSFEPAQLSIAAGSISAALVYTAPAASVASLVCSFSYVSGDVRFVDLSPSVAFSVLQPVLTFSGVTNGAALLTGSHSNLTVAANAPIDGELRLTVICLAVVPPGSFNIIVLSGTVIVAASETAGSVPLSAPLQPLSAGVECNIYPQSGDSRFNRPVVTDAIPAIVFTVALPTVTLNGLTEGAQVQAGSTQRLTLTVSHPITVDDLTVNVTCPGASVSGYFRIDVASDISSQTRVIVPADAAVGTAFTCTFQYLRGDIRYTHAAMPAALSFSVAPVPVVEPSSSTGDAGGDSASFSSTAGITGGTGGDDPSGLLSSSTATVLPCTDDSECGAVAQAASGLASLALAVAAAAALRS